MFKPKALSVCIICSIMNITVGCGGAGSDKSANELTQKDEETTSTTDSATYVKNIYSNNLVVDYFFADIADESLGVKLDEDIDSIDYTASHFKYGEIKTVTDSTDASKTTYYYHLLDENKNKLITDTDTIVFKNKSGDTVTKTIYLYSDYLLPGAWHLSNNGSYKYADGRSLSGHIDYDVAKFWAAGLTGKNINIVLVDSELEKDHEDLKDNFNKKYSYNFYRSSLGDGYDSQDPSFVSKDGKTGHGTAVAGIIAAVANNYIGSRGIAYNSKISEISYLGEKNSDSINYGEDILNKILISTYDSSSPFRIVNNSWGVDNDSQKLEDATTQYLDTLTKDYKTILVQSAGNYFIDTDVSNYNTCYTLGVECSFVQNVSLSVHPQTITVSSLLANGAHAPYSDAGTHVWVSGLGGGKYNEQNTGPLVLATDLMGCSSGYSSSRYLNTNFAFDRQWSSAEKTKYNENSDCNYSVRMNGTSAAAPGISAIISLLLEKNNSLDASQIRYILAKAANYAIEDSNAIYYESLNSNMVNSVKPISLSTYGNNINNFDLDIYLGWIKNAAGYRYNPMFGFGFPDTQKAIDLAQECADSTSKCAAHAINKQGYATFVSSNDTPCVEETYLVRNTNSFNVNYNGFKYTCKLDRLLSEKNNEEYFSDANAGYFNDIDSVQLKLDSGFRFDNTRNDSNLRINPKCSQISSNFLFSADGKSNYADIKRHLQIELTSPKNTKSIVKNMFQELGTVSSKLILKDNTFYGESITSDDSGFTATIYSDCPLELPTNSYNLDLNKNFLSIKVFGFNE